MLRYSNLSICVNPHKIQPVRPKKYLELIRAQEIRPTFKLDYDLFAVILDPVFGLSNAPVSIFGKLFQVFIFLNKHGIYKLKNLISLPSSNIFTELCQIFTEFIVIGLFPNFDTSLVHMFFNFSEIFTNKYCVFPEL
jgi:hypothetical protein